MRAKSGDIAEIAFHLAASRLGFITASPVNNNTVYDVLFDSGPDIKKIQVKGNFSKGHCFGFNISRGNKDKVSYTSKEVHFIACYINCINLWYIIPIDLVTKIKKITLFPNGKLSKWNKYKEAWHLLC